MNEDGTLPVIAISPTKDQLGYYNKKGKFVDSKIPIYTNDFFEKWVTITIRRVKEKEDNLLTKKIAWFSNGKYISSTIIKVKFRLSAEAVQPNSAARGALRIDQP